jgi:uncharacterized protein involved in response to NO
MNSRPVFNLPLLALGFRPFFMLAGLSALILLLLWNLMLSGMMASGNYFMPTYWHAHEMLLGYTVAVIAGFLLTAVKNWTGKPTISGGKLAGLSIIWLLGRIAPFCSGFLPNHLIALVDILFLPVLMVCIGRPIAAAKQSHNLIFIGLLLLILIGNILVHIELLGYQESTARLGLHLILYTIITLTLIIAGRVVPFFTERGLPGVVLTRNPKLDNGSIWSAILFFAFQLLDVTAVLLVIAGMLAAIINGIRLAGWYTKKIWDVPLLWILYVGCGWIILGFACSAFSAYSLIQPSLSLHAFTVGGIGALTLSMMARVSLGHTGRLLVASRAIAIAFVLINVAAFIRIVLPIALPHWYQTFIYGSSLAWLSAFSLFIFVYTPILTAKRIDGLEG